MKGNDIVIRDGFIISNESVEPLPEGVLIAHYASMYSRLENEVRALALMCTGHSDTMFESENDYVRIIAEFVKSKIARE